MDELNLEMKFDPQTIKHLGLRMYSHLAPALAELVSNAYDADANQVIVTLIENSSGPLEIIVEDDGEGLSIEDIQNKFLIIGRNRRTDEGEKRSARNSRLPTGKKGLGKLALFGLAKTIRLVSVKEKKKSEIEMDWDALMSAVGVYKPKVILANKIVDEPNGTTVYLTQLKRKSAFDIEGIADSLSKIFLFDNSFKLVVQSHDGDRISVDNKRRYNSISNEFEWDLASPLLVPIESEYHGKLTGKLITSEKPLPASSGLRGVTLFSRGKLVNNPDSFSKSTSSHFFQYLTGWITIDFVDLIDDDVISTNRQSIDWEHPDTENLYKFLAGIISTVNSEWRKKRKEKKQHELKTQTGIDTSAWLNTVPKDVEERLSNIIESLGGEDALEKYAPVIKNLHELIPEYPLIHWRHLHPDVQEKSREHYIGKNYYVAFMESMKKYVAETRRKSGVPSHDESDIIGGAYSATSGKLNVVGNYLKSNSEKFSDKTIGNIRIAHHKFSEASLTGARHPIAHEEIDELRGSGIFSEKDCLDLLSLLSHLFKRLDNSVKV